MLREDIRTERLRVDNLINKLTEPQVINTVRKEPSVAKSLKLPTLRDKRANLEKEHTDPALEIRRKKEYNERIETLNASLKDIEEKEEDK